MAIAAKLKTYLDQHGGHFKLVTHPHTASSMETAEVTHVPGDALAKGVLLKNGAGYLLVVLPADYHVELERLNRLLKREMQMAEEAELQGLFPDCELGAVPPIGPAYGITTVWDVALGDQEKVYFEAGDHEHLVRVTGRHFHELMAQAERGEFSRHI